MTLATTYSSVRIGQHDIQIEQTRQVFAHVLDRPGMVAVMVHEFAVDGVPQNLVNAWFDQAHEKGPLIEYHACTEATVLPFLKKRAIVDVAEHAFYAPANVFIMAQVRAGRGVHAMQNYAEVQSMIGMPGCPFEGEHPDWIGAEQDGPAQ